MKAWATVGAVALFFVLVSGALLLRASMVSRPTSPIDPVVEKETRDRKRALEDAKKLFSAGKYEQSLALLRQVLARSPANQQARQYAQMAENALAGRAEAERKSAEAERSLESARVALSEKRYDDAIRIADATLVLEEDPRMELIPVEKTGGTLTDDQRRFRASWLGSQQRR